MCADIFQQPMEVDRQEQESLFGGVVLAMKHSGVIDDAVNYETVPCAVIRSNPALAGWYHEKFERYLECCQGNACNDHRHY